MSITRQAAYDGADVVVDSLIAAGVEVVFGISGIHGIRLFDAVSRSSLRLIVPRHEQGAAFMADGYARATGKVGVCLTTTGPGAANTMAAMGTAYMDSSRVLQIATQQAQEYIGTFRGRGHDTKDQLGMFQAVTQWNTRIESPAMIRPVVAEAFHRLDSGRPRPVQIDLPLDMQSTPFSALPPRLDAVTRDASPSVDADAIAHAARLLAAARRPAIWIGGGVMTAEAHEEVDHLARRLGAPIFSSAMGKNGASADHPLFLGPLIIDADVRHALAECDLLLTLGTTFRADDTGDWQLRLPPLIQIDIEADQIGKNYPVCHAITGDIRIVLRAVLATLGTKEHPGLAAMASKIGMLREGARTRARARYPTELAIVEQIRAGMPRDAILVFDRTLPLYWAVHYLDVFLPRTFFQSAEFGTLGWAFPAALGAQVAHPDRRVLCVAGDGGIMFTCQELATAAEHRIPVTLLVVNDCGYGSNRRNAMHAIGRVNPADTFPSPDFVQLARAFGIPARRLGSVNELADALATAPTGDGPYLIELPLDTIEFPPRDGYGTDDA